MDKEQIKNKIISALLPLQPEKVILFGSYAKNTEHDDSDVDIYIVSNEDYLPVTHAENMRHYSIVDARLS